MRPVSHTLIDSVSAPIDEVFALLTDPRRMIAWLPTCDDVYVQSAGPLVKGARLVVRFGERVTAFEVVDFVPPRTFGWIERGLRQGTKTFFRLDPTGSGTAVTVREVWTPVTFRAWLRARLRPKRDVPRRLRRIIENLRTALAR
jgi:uncharacterized protein YndB with AHSA1/START domain